MSIMQYHVDAQQLVSLTIVNKNVNGKVELIKRRMEIMFRVSRCLETQKNLKNIVFTE